MPDWQSLALDRAWPLALAAVAITGLVILWRSQHGGQLPDAVLRSSAQPWRIHTEALLPAVGLAILLLLALAMTRPEITVETQVEQQARDFIVLVDTSRSMRHDTAVQRADMQLRFERRVAAFSDAVEDPNQLPFVARFELARESLYDFLANRRAEDRVALVYFNDDVHPVAAFTRNISLVARNLAAMDDYVNWGTNIAAAMDSSIRMVERYPGKTRRTMILITDAETRFTEDLEMQFQRLTEAGLAFYLLWITADEQPLSSDDGHAFRSLAESAGTVVTIHDPNAQNLEQALFDIGRSESYEYETLRRHSVDLSTPLLHIARILLMIWLCLLVSWMHPSVIREPFDSYSASDYKATK